MKILVDKVLRNVTSPGKVLNKNDKIRIYLGAYRFFEQRGCRKSFIDLLDIWYHAIFHSDESVSIWGRSFDWRFWSEVMISCAISTVESESVTPAFIRLVESICWMWIGTVLFIFFVLSRDSNRIDILWHKILKPIF